MESPVLLAMILWLPCIAGQINNNCTENVCTTKECISVAHDMLETLDESIDPCQDFYQYACGGWIRNQWLRPDEDARTRYNSELPFVSIRKILANAHTPTDLDAVNKAKKMYTSCVRYATGISIYKEIARVVNATFGRWPLTCDNCPMDGFHLDQFLLEAIELGVHPLFKLTALVTPTASPTPDSPRRHLFITDPELGFPVTQYAQLSNKWHFRQIYAHRIYSAATHFGIENHERAENEAMEIVHVETRLAEIQYNHTGALRYLDVAELNPNYGQLLNWTSFVTRLKSFETWYPYIDVAVSPSDYIQNMTDYFSQLPARTQANYIIWRVIDTLQSVLLDKQTILNPIALQYINRDTRVPMPEESCARYVSKVFHQVVYRMLSDAQLPGNNVYTLNLMKQSLHREIGVLLEEHVRINPTNHPFLRYRNNAISKLQEFLLQAMNDSYLETYYSNVTIYRRHFIRNVVEMRKDTFAKEFSFPVVYHSLSEAERPGIFQDILGSYLNRKNINSVMVEPPSWIHNVPASINFGRIGEVLARDLIHGVVTGNNFNNPWWFLIAINYFHDRYQCLVDQYSSFFYAPAGRNVDGISTREEDTTDNAGLKLAHKAYINYTMSGIAIEQQLPGLNLSNEQIFFLAYAQMHCTVDSNKFAKKMISVDNHSPHEFRVVGPLQNSPEFANAFNCPVGSRMNPESKCDAW